MGGSLVVGLAAALAYGTVRDWRLRHHLRRHEPEVYGELDAEKRRIEERAFERTGHHLLAVTDVMAAHSVRSRRSNLWSDISRFLGIVRSRAAGFFER